MGSPVRTDTVQLLPHYVPAGKAEDLDFQKNSFECFYFVAKQLLGWQKWWLAGRNQKSKMNEPSLKMYSS